MSEAQGFEKSVDKLVSAGRSLWLAGLGAVASMEEGGRDLFDRLVERGRPLEKRQRKTFAKVGERTQKTVRNLGKFLEDTMEYETKGVLKRLGLLTRDDVKALAARLDSLSRKIDEIAARHDIGLDDEALPELAIEIHPKPRKVRTPPVTAASGKERRPRQHQH